MIKPHYLFEVWRPDEVAECLEGMTASLQHTSQLYHKLWSFAVEYKAPPPEVSEEPCYGMDSLSSFWHRLDESEQVRLNYLAKCHDEGEQP